MPLRSMDVRNYIIAFVIRLFECEWDGEKHSFQHVRASAPSSPASLLACILTRCIEVGVW